VKRPHNTRHRGAERARKSAKAPRAKPETPPTRHIPPYGDVPLVPVRYLDHAGREHEWLDYDPDFAPPLPPGAVRGDVRKQSFCRMCYEPRYYYLDIARVCAQCGCNFVFRAVEQKLWCETLGFYHGGLAIRCLPCRRKRRSLKALHLQLTEAKKNAQLNPERADSQLALAEALVRYHQRHHAGSLADALAAARKARRLLRGHSARELRETLFWEGMAHALAGRSDRARERLLEFVDSGIAGRRLTALAKEARALLAAQSAAPTAAQMQRNR
jgi:hypothetical protein